ncbi:nucleoside phosphorylase [Nonlabens antarcticus]|uniref:nucleoside phosphorylase n=1 Tax=Nonlabens antarcticus TaxID=392714 RepID=UPI00189158F1|nr:nucleoside phosphorylase [Nonlabens antarcticus]
MALSESELILNKDGSIYHLNLRPEQLAPIIITVGDPERVPEISKYFDAIECKVGKREFHTHTGTFKGKRISVVSTGIGTDNIDIVFNELDALVNIDFDTRQVKEKLTSLDIIRVGTTGAVQPNTPIDSFLLSQRGIGFDSLLHWYENDISDKKFTDALVKELNLSENMSKPYIVSCDRDLARQFQTIEMLNGTTITNVGFYGPQSRSLRLAPSNKELKQLISNFNYDGHQITNLEMETSGIYAMSHLLGHRAISLNSVVANRATGQFSSDPEEAVEKLIRFTLERIATL